MKMKRVSENGRNVKMVGEEMMRMDKWGKKKKINKKIKVRGWNKKIMGIFPYKKIIRCTRKEGHFSVKLIRKNFLILQ